MSFRLSPLPSPPPTISYSVSFISLSLHTYSSPPHTHTHTHIHTHTPMHTRTLSHTPVSCWIYGAPKQCFISYHGSLFRWLVTIMLIAGCMHRTASLCVQVESSIVFIFPVIYGSHSVTPYAIKTNTSIFVNRSLC